MGAATVRRLLERLVTNRLSEVEIAADAQEG